MKQSKQIFGVLLLVLIIFAQKQDIFEQQSIAATIQALQNNDAQTHYSIMIQKPLHDLQKRTRQQQVAREQIGVGIYILNCIVQIVIQ